MSRTFAAPLQAIDRVESVSCSGVEAVKEIVSTDPYLCGHYPRFTIYPGIFTIESVHQAVRRMVALAHGEDAVAEIVSIVSVRFTAPLLPGDVLWVSCVGVPAKSTDTDAIRVKATCHRFDGAVAATMTLVLRVRAGGAS